MYETYWWWEHDMSWEELSVPAREPAFLHGIGQASNGPTTAYYVVPGH